MALRPCGRCQAAADGQQEEWPKTGHVGLSDTGGWRSDGGTELLEVKEEGIERPGNRRHVGLSVVQ